MAIIREKTPLGLIAMRDEPRADAADFVYLGEMRVLKGIATLLEAMAQLGGQSRLALVGAGPDDVEQPQLGLDL